jgi:NADH:ubiquinone oxidoreductase subunit H
MGPLFTVIAHRSSAAHRQARDGPRRVEQIGVYPEIGTGHLVRRETLFERSANRPPIQLVHARDGGQRLLL